MNSDPSPIEFELEADSEGDVVIIRASGPFGHIRIMAEVVAISEAQAVLGGVHVQGPGANRVGLRLLRRIAAAAKERLRVDEIVIQGGLRTSGANPGRYPRPIRF